MATRQKKQSIRDAILLLSSLLNECGVPKFSVECFRLAKFDKCEAETDLWLLMYHVMQLLTFLQKATDDSSLCTDSCQFFKPSEAKLSVVSKNVREYLFTMGYTRPQFYTMHNNNVSSRELLLAWSWLICKLELVPSLTNHFLSASKRIEIPLKDVHQSVVEQLINENDKMQGEIEGVISFLTSTNNKVDKTVEAFHRLIWLKNNVDYKWKEMRRVQTAYQKVAHEIYQCTKRVRPSLSKHEPSGLRVDEVFLLRYPDQMKLHLRKLSKCASVLELVVQWLHCEPLFWQWMESVMDLQEDAELARQLEVVGTDNHTSGNVEMPEDAHANNAEQGNEKKHTKGLDKDKEDLVAQWCVLQDEMKCLLERNQLYMGKARKVLEHKSRMVEQSLVNRQQQASLSQLQSECPCVGQLVKSTQPVIHSMLGGLAPIDRPRFVPEGGCVGRPPQASGRYHKAGEVGDFVDDACAEEGMMVAKLQALDADLESCKSQVATILASMEEWLPPTLYKLNQVTNLRHAGTV